METPPLVRTNGSHDVDWLREQLRTLATGCPHTKSNPDGCPLHDVRQLEPAAIIDWLDGLSLEEKDFLMLYHQCCLVINRERDALSAPPAGRETSARRTSSRRLTRKSAAVPPPDRALR